MAYSTSDPLVELDNTHKKKARIALSILVAVHLAVCAFIATAGSLSGTGYWQGIIFGLLFGQCSLLAVWASLGPQKIIQRVPIALFLLGLLALAISNMAMVDGSGITEVVLFAGLLLLQWLAVQSPLWAIRLIWKVQLVWPGQELLPVIRDDFRFSLKQIMTWTAAVAVLLGVGRLIFSAVKSSDFDFSFFVPQLVICLIILFFNVLIALLTIWGALSRWKPLVCFFLSMVTVLIAGVVEPFLINAALGIGSEIGLFLSMAMVHFALLAGNLLLLRWSGFRLATLRSDPAG